MKRKIVSILVCAAMAAAMMTGCGSASQTGGEASSSAADAGNVAASDGELIKVGIINNDPNESGYRTANDRDMKEKFCEENGFDASFFYSLENEEQINAAQQFIQDEVDYLLISAADTTGWDTVLQDAQEMGVSVILFDRLIDADESLYEAAVVSDMPAEGETAVAWIESQGLDEYN
ncbi:MAG: substrate-binding domain-containing protein, partial [Lachnospiraceae bacterium]|nr:substrate-binding domain-containing protein [Lachnospiraceae bacterium]